jgi:predicted NAD/FAD-binding protein
VFIATHSNQALAMLSEPDDREERVLGAIPYQKNEAVLHTDTSLLPRRRLAWAAWNYHILPSEARRVAVTYNMNILQGLDEQQTYCVTLNNTDAIDPARIIKRMSYDHPVYTVEGVRAQNRHNELNGIKRTFYCGAYWGNGFHEDGVVSAMNALNDFFKQVSGHEQLHIRRPG